MTQPSGISRRIQQCFEHILNKDWEGALVNLFPALDKTAKKRRPKERVGTRIRAFLEDEELLISTAAIGTVFTGNRANGLSIPDALYQFGRTSIVHEGELDPRLHFDDSGMLVMGAERWSLPSSYILGMSLAVIVAPENKYERISNHLTLTLLDQQLQINELWGQKTIVQKIICDRFRVKGAGVELNANQ